MIDDTPIGSPMKTPYIPPIKSFNALQDYIFSFEVPVGGHQVTANEVVITNAQGVEEYRHTDLNSYVYTQTIPAKTLLNTGGAEAYYIKVRTFDKDGLSSQWSTPVMFYCYPPLQMEFSVSDGDVFNTSAVTMTLEYFQTLDNWLNYATIEVYNTNGELIESSGELYNQAQIHKVPVSYTFTGLINETDYYVNYYAESIHGTTASAENIHFRIHYTTTLSDAPLSVKAFNCDGYVRARSRMSFVEGHTSPNAPVYVNNDALNLVDTVADWEASNLAPTVNFHGGYKIKPNEGFTLRLWFNPAFVNHKIATLYNDNNTEKIIVYYMRGQRYDYVVATSTAGAYICSNGIPHCNGNSYLYLFLQCKADGTWTNRLKEISKIQTIWRWNDDNSNVIYNFSTDIPYEDYEIYTPQSTTNVSYNNPITNINLGNGYFYKMVVDDGTIAYTDAEPMSFADEEGTILYCDFNGNLHAGSSTMSIDRITGFKIKRIDENTKRWIELSFTPISPASDDDIVIEYKDYTVPSGIEQMYALVPTMNGDIEGNYVTQTITPNWKYSFISDNTNCFKVAIDVQYGGDEHNVPTGILNPIGSKYPIIIQNGDNNYLTGSISAKLMGYNFLETKYVDRKDVVKQKNDFLQFLSNGKAKVFKDWNGNILIFRRTTSSVNYVNTYANGIVDINFSWVEQGNYDDEKSLKDAGII